MWSKQVLNAHSGCHVTVHCLQDASSNPKVKFYWEDSFQIVELAHRTCYNRNIAQLISHVWKQGIWGKTRSHKLQVQQARGQPWGIAHLALSCPHY